MKVRPTWYGGWCLANGVGVSMAIPWNAGWLFWPAVLSGLVWFFAGLMYDSPDYRVFRPLMTRFSRPEPPDPIAEMVRAKRLARAEDAYLWVRRFEDALPDDSFDREALSTLRREREDPKFMSPVDGSWARYNRVGELDRLIKATEAWRNYRDRPIRMAMTKVSRS